MIESMKARPRPLPPSEPLADAGEVGVVVEAVFLEDGHDSAVFHLAIFYNQVEEQLAHLRASFRSRKRWCLITSAIGNMARE